jgi:hypothetical protein
MKVINNFLIILISTTILSCSSQTDKIQDVLNPFMTENYSQGTYSVTKERNTFRLIIKDKNSLSEDTFEDVMLLTLGTFYKSFYDSSNSAGSNTELIIEYYSKDKEWESEPYDLFKLGEIFEIVKK